MALIVKAKGIYTTDIFLIPCKSNKLAIGDKCWANSGETNNTAKQILMAMLIKEIIVGVFVFWAAKNAREIKGIIADASNEKQNTPSVAAVSLVATQSKLLPKDPKIILTTWALNTNIITDAGITSEIILLNVDETIFENFSLSLAAHDLDKSGNVEIENGIAKSPTGKNWILLA